MLRARYTDALIGDEHMEGQVRLFIGPRHPQSLPEDEIEVLVQSSQAPAARPSSSTSCHWAPSSVGTERSTPSDGHQPQRLRRA